MLALATVSALALHTPLPRTAAVPTLRRHAVSSPQMMAVPATATAALALNTAAYSLNGVIYLTPVRATVLKSLFGIDGADVLSPIVGAFQFLGGLHAAIAIQCAMALVGLRSWRETLVGMAILHAIQAAVGLGRVLAHRRAGVKSLEALLGAGGGPAVGAAVLGLVSLVAVL
jgi:hypothetical protein